MNHVSFYGPDLWVRVSAPHLYGNALGRDCRGLGEGR